MSNNNASNEVDALKGHRPAGWLPNTTAYDAATPAALGDGKGGKGKGRKGKGRRGGRGRTAEVNSPVDVPVTCSTPSVVCHRAAHKDVMQEVERPLALGVCESSEDICPCFRCSGDGSHATIPKTYCTFFAEKLADKADAGGTTQHETSDEALLQGIQFVGRTDHSHGVTEAPHHAEGIIRHLPCSHKPREFERPHSKQKKGSRRLRKALGQQRKEKGNCLKSM